MPTDHRAQVEDLLADYRRSREQLATVHRTLSAIEESASSDDGLVTATVGAQGTLANLVIADGAYQRYRPAELARLVVRTTAAAAAKAAERAHRALAPVLPAATDPDALLHGRADLDPSELAPPPRRPSPETDGEDSFESRSWLDAGHARSARRPG